MRIRNRLARQLSRDLINNGTITLKWKELLISVLSGKTLPVVGNNTLISQLGRVITLLLSSGCRELSQ